MLSKRPTAPFREGDEVVLGAGTYQGTLGVFVRYRADANWADITERNGIIRSHPVVWLDHMAGLPDGAGAPDQTAAEPKCHMTT